MFFLVLRTYHFAALFKKSALIIMCLLKMQLTMSHNLTLPLYFLFRLFSFSFTIAIYKLIFAGFLVDFNFPRITLPRSKYQLFSK